MENAIYNNSGRKFIFYSASDNNVNTVNLAFKIVNYATNYDQWLGNLLYYSNAPFASTLLFEIYEE